jgi:hypothetical protein
MGSIYRRVRRWPRIFEEDARRPEMRKRAAR